MKVQKRPIIKTAKTGRGKKTSRVNRISIKGRLPNGTLANESSTKGRNFWQALPRPFFAIAPMANVTDAVFRKMFAKYGKPDVTWTEFVSADGLNSAGQKRLLVDLEYTEKERPIVAQLFTGRPEEMKKAAGLIAELGFDGLDINMGCPDRAVQKQGGGAALIKSPKLALDILAAAREGVKVMRASTEKVNDQCSMKQCLGQCDVQCPDDDAGIPVSVKTRIGFNTIDLGWIELLLKQNLPVLTVHLRTRKEMSDEPAHWDLMPRIVEMRNRISPSTLLIGNGDVESIGEAREHCEKYGCDGVMIGRGVFGKPWFFSGIEKSPADRKKILIEHTKLFEKTYCGKKHLKNFDVMKKHFKAYISGWEGAKELRTKLMNTKNAMEVKEVLEVSKVPKVPKVPKVLKVRKVCKVK
ncbi:MAG: tRNA-dihydrouridine synthase [Candidatus Taylorbacteria bacterium]